MLRVLMVGEVMVFSPGGSSGRAFLPAVRSQKQLICTNPRSCALLRL